MVFVVISIGLSIKEKVERGYGWMVEGGFRLFSEFVLVVYDS